MKSAASFAFALSTWGPRPRSTPASSSVVTAAQATAGDPPLTPCEALHFGVERVSGCPERLDNAAAAADCARRDAALATIGSREENEFIAARSRACSWAIGSSAERVDDALVLELAGRHDLLARRSPDGAAEPGSVQPLENGGAEQRQHHLAGSGALPRAHPHGRRLERPRMHAQSALHLRARSLTWLLASAEDLYFCSSSVAA